MRRRVLSLVVVGALAAPGSARAQAPPAPAPAPTVQALAHWREALDKRTPLPTRRCWARRVRGTSLEVLYTFGPDVVMVLAVKRAE